MPQGWEWDETLFRGSAAYYVRGRLPYPRGLTDAFTRALQLDGRGRLLDVGCGPGLIALSLAHRFEEVVGLDADADMVVEAARLAADAGVHNARWVHARAEELPLDLGQFRVATFAQSFHWMDRDTVAATVYRMLAPGGAFVQVSAQTESAPPPRVPLPHPVPPRDAIQALVERYLGPERRAGLGVLRFGTPGDEASVLRNVGFGEPDIVPVPGGEVVVRTTDDIVAAVFATSARAPHLFGERLDAFEADLRALLGDGPYAEQTGDAELRMWRTPNR